VSLPFSTVTTNGQSQEIGSGRQSITKPPRALGKQPRLFKDLEDWSQNIISVMITDDSTSTPEEIWRHYRPLANDENVIKDLKEGYSFESFNVHNFWATEAVLTMIALVPQPDSLP